VTNFVPIFSLDDPGRPVNCDGVPVTGFAGTEDAMGLTLKFTFVVFFCAAAAFTAGSILATWP
jgi:hypothetical protein